MYSVPRLFVMFGIFVPYCDCLITVGSNPISAPNFDPLRSRANCFIIDTKHLQLVRLNCMLSGLLDPVQDHHSQSVFLLHVCSLIIQYNHNIHLKIIFFYSLYHYDMKLCYSDNMPVSPLYLTQVRTADFLLKLLADQIML